MNLPNTYILDDTIDLFAEALACKFRVAQLATRLEELGCQVDDARDFAFFTLAAMAAVFSGDDIMKDWPSLTLGQIKRVFELRFT